MIDVYQNIGAQEVNEAVHKIILEISDHFKKQYEDTLKLQSSLIAAREQSLNELHIELNQLLARAEAAEAELAELKERMRWIPVGEKAPEGDDLVIVLSDRRREVAFYAFDDWWASDGDELEFIPTHWMPLPEPPKENN